MERKVNLIVFNLAQESEALLTLSDKFSSDNQVNFSIVRLYQTVIETLKDDRQGIFFFKVESKAEFVQSLKILKLNQALIKRGFIRPICLLGVNSQKVERLLIKYGCGDMLQLNVNPKTLFIKTELWVKSLWSLLKDEQGDLTLARREQDHIEGESNSLKLKKLDLTAEELFESDYLDEFEEEIDKEFSISSGPYEKTEGDHLGFKIVTTEESTPELVEYIKENGEVGQLNLETGFLGLMLSSDANGESYNAVFDNFEEDLMTLEVASECAAKNGEKLKVAVKFVYNKCRVEIDLDGKVSEVEDLEDGGKLVTISFAENESEIYEYFMSLYEKRQKSINDFMELARGY